MSDEPTPGVMHPIDRAFHALTVKERDYERVRSDRLERERDEARAEVERLRAQWDALTSDAVIEGLRLSGYDRDPEAVILDAIEAAQNA
jgi:hypothetical protein